MYHKGGDQALLFSEKRRKVAMRREINRWVFVISLLSLLILTSACANTLQVTEYQLTSSSANETWPTIGNDGTSDLVVFTVQPMISGVPGPADIWCQRLDADGAPSGYPVQVASADTHDWLNDISGDYIVYTAHEGTISDNGSIMLYQISTRDLQPIATAMLIQESRIHGNWMVWREGIDAGSQVMLYNLSWLGTPTDPMVLAGVVPTVYDVQIGDRFVVWAEFNAGQFDIMAYDLAVADSTPFAVTNTTGVDEKRPAISGPWVLWQAMDRGSSGDRGFIYDGTTYRTLHVPEAIHTYTYGINDAGSVVGYYIDPSHSRHGFIYDGTTYTTFDVPEAIHTFAYGLNDAGTVVGQYEDASYQHHGFIYDGTTYRTLDVPEAVHTSAYGINDAGIVVGSYRDPGESRIEAINLDTAETRVIVDDGAVNSDPSIDGDLVTWDSDVNDNLDVFVYRISTGETFQVTTDPADQYLNDVFGDLVAYVDTRGLTEDVYVAKLEFKPDGDNDGIPDDQDACPDEDATGFDADGDGCIDSLGGLTVVIKTLVEAGAIEPQMETSLIEKVENAEESNTQEDICAAVNELEAFKNQIEAQRGNKISDEAADLVIAYADNLITQLLDKLPPGESC
jgi:hypothetical protein